MKFNLKAGLLVILLAAPAFVFLFLFFFGENKFDLPYLLPIASIEKNEQLELANTNSKEFDYLIQFADKNSIYEDTLFLKVPTAQRAKTTPHILIIYYGPVDALMDENQQSEILRINEKIQNQENVLLLNLYKEKRMNETYWKSLRTYLQNTQSEYFQSSGMLFLVDSNGFYRGSYDPSIKAEIDRLVTEYQIIQKF